MFFSCWKYLKLPEKARRIASQNLGANIRRVFSLANGNKNYLELFLLLLQQAKTPVIYPMSRYFLSIVSGLVFALSFGQTQLQYNLRKGEVFTIKQEAVQQITQDMDGNRHEITSSLEGVLEFRVLSVGGNSYEMAVEFKDLRLYMYSSSEGELLDIDASEIAEGDVPSKIFNSLLNVPIRIVLERSGKVLSVKGGDSLVSRMASASGVEDSFTLDLMKESLDRDFGTEALSNSYEQMTFIYPGREIRIGDSWENEYEGKISSSNHWTLDGLKGGHATISGKAEVNMDLQEQTASMSLKGNRKTELSADLISGFLVVMKVESHSEGFSAIQELGSTTIPTTINTTITSKRI
jgi:hypothetical protein